MVDNKSAKPVESRDEEFRLGLNEQIAPLALVHPADTLSHEAAKN
ncbi:MAG TPA: hypothetical protein VEW26_12150 [Allosphingosinicella sp.]|nr:hypothetical protein [Allosphingosinicella sp.]